MPPRRLFSAPNFENWRKGVVAGLLQVFLVGHTLLQPCVASAQSVDHGPHRLGLRLGAGPFYGGVDEDGHHQDKGLGYSGSLDYGYLLNQHLEAGALTTYWSSETAVTDAFLVGGRLRGIITFGKKHTGELGLEVRGGYLGMLTPDIKDDVGAQSHDHYWSGFAASASIDGGAWIDEHWGFVCGANYTLGGANDTSGIRGYYLPSRGALLSLEGRCGVRLAL